MATVAASTAASAISARPRLVCSTVPVRLNTGLRLGSACFFQAGHRAAGECPGIGGAFAAGAGFRNRLAHRGDGGGAAEAFDGAGRDGVTHHLIDRGQLARHRGSFCHRGPQ